jgi:hypothetical protein
MQMVEIEKKTLKKSRKKIRLSKEAPGDKIKVK